MTALLTLAFGFTGLVISMVTNLSTSRCIAAVASTAYAVVLALSRTRAR
jgi:ABC-type Mn2+/Zn2+ transport system permease subunit